MKSSYFLNKTARFALIFVLGALSCAASAQTVVEEIVAKVNNEIITKSDLKRERETLQTEIKQQNAPDGDRKFADAEKNILSDLISERLLVQKGNDLGVSVDAEVIKRLDEMRKSMNLESMEDLEKAASAQGVSFEDFKANMKNNMIKQAVIGKEVGSHVQVPPSEVAKFYEEHKSEMKQPESVELAEIIVAPASAPPAAPADGKTPEPAVTDDPAKLAAAEAKANELLKAIKGGAKFEEVAQKSSDGPTAKDGGALGEFKRGALAKEIEDKVFALKAGDVTDVIRTKQGYLILKVLAHNVEGIPPQKDVEQQIMEQLYYQKLQPALKVYVTKLREDAFIDIKPGYVDTSASPNQTKPVYTASNEESAGKKAKRKRKLGIF